MNGFTIAPVDRNRMALLQAKHGLKAIKQGFRLSRGHTPKRCREIIEACSGKKFKARAYDDMIAEAERLLEGGEA